MEIIPKGVFFDFENKYDPNNLAQEICPVDIEKSLTKELQRQDVVVHETLRIKHLSRSDFIVTPKSEIYFLEVNTIPGMTEVSLISKMLKEANLSLGDFLKDRCLDVCRKN